MYVCNIARYKIVSWTKSSCNWWFRRLITLWYFDILCGVPWASSCFHDNRYSIAIDPTFRAAFESEIIIKVASDISSISWIIAVRVSAVLRAFHHFFKVFCSCTSEEHIALSHFYNYNYFTSRGRAPERCLNTQFTLNTNKTCNGLLDVCLRLYAPIVNW